MWSKVAVTLLLLTALERRCTGSEARPLETADAGAFADSLGVDVHLQYDETSYGSFPHVRQALEYLGVRHVRDSALRRGPRALNRYVDLARSGYRFDLFLNADQPAQLAHVRTILAASPTSVASLEGPNEVNNDPVHFEGRTAVEGARAYQAALYAAIKRDERLAPIPVLNYTNFPPTSGDADAVNVHSYAKHGRSPGPQLEADIRLTGASQPRGRPVFVTETGYATSPSARGVDAVGEEDQAALIVVGWLDAFRAGVKRTYVYELLDEAPAGTRPDDPEHYYGVFDANGRPKPAARMLRTLIASLRSAAAPFSGAAPSLTVTGAGVKRLVLTRPDGSALLAIWRETGLEATSADVILRLAQPADVRRLDPLTGRESAALPPAALTFALRRAPAWFIIQTGRKG